MAHWLTSIQLKLVIGFILIVTTLVMTTAFILETHLHDELEQQTLKQIESSGANLVAELNQRTTMANAIAQSIAQFVASAPADDALLVKVLPSIINAPRGKQWISGGGYWPEPYAHNPLHEHNSFFWGKDQDQNLQLLNVFNQQGKPGYHNQEWYIPVKHLKQGQCYWSRIYIAAYSDQPVVTCTTAIYKDGILIGAATIDLRLKGLTDFFADAGQIHGGYSFVIDQDNHFITPPNKTSFESIGHSDQSINAGDKASSTFTRALGSSAQKADAKASQTRQQLKSAADEHYPVDFSRAALISAALTGSSIKPDDTRMRMQQIVIQNDPVLKDMVTASIFDVPGTFWKVVVVTSNTYINSTIQGLIEQTLFKLIIPIFTVLGLGFLGLRQLVVNPIMKITQQLKANSSKKEFFTELDENRADEYGHLAYWYNKQSRWLAEAMGKLSSANDELKNLATYDDLTNLNNRNHFEASIEQLIKDDTWNNYAIIFMDIDQFKVINDTCGHLAGDSMLIQIGQSLSALTRVSDFVSRIGGDEFALIIKAENLDQAMEFAERIRKDIQLRQFAWEERIFNATCSLGVVHLTDVHKDKTTALRYVDNACYAAKDAGRNRVQSFRPDDDAMVEREGEMNWLFEIRRALNDDKLVLEFQYICPINEKSGLSTSIESLVRIRDAKGVLLPPGAFLPAAERYNVIQLIDNWVIEHTFACLSKNKSILDSIDFCAINLSGDTIGNVATLPYINKMMAKYAIPANKLCFEITEIQVVSNLDSARAILNSLREMGCKIALDDFGKGMSSYSYLKELPVDIVKIDGHFVCDICSDKVHHTFVKSIHDIASSMGLLTVAEFVQDQETLVELKKIGVNYAQGYGISKPQECDVFIEKHIKQIQNPDSDDKPNLYAVQATTLRLQGHSQQ